MTGAGPVPFWLCFVAASLGLFAAPSAEAQQRPSPVRLTTSIGFDGVYRAGAWTPVYVTLQAPAPRAVVIELSLPHDNSYSMRITQAVTANPQPATYLLLAPAPGDVEGGRVIVRDAGTGRTLADADLDTDPSAGRAPGGINLRAFGAGYDEQLIGFAGSTARPKVLVGTLPDASIRLGAVPEPQLPRDALGYDGLDVLMLGAPDLAAMDREAQSAVADWVAAGGTLVFWPSAAPLPPPSSAPVVGLLPAEVGEPDLSDVSPGDRAAFGLPERFAKLPVRRLTPIPAAEALDLLGPSIRGYSADVALGRVVILPFDPTLLPLEPRAAGAFWQPILRALLGPERIPAVNRAAANNRMINFANWARLQGAGSGLDAAVNAIGDIPGVGQFGFSWVLLVLVGLMVVVGPVDWWVLKKLGRQPWTILTTTGWIALVTLGALYLGTILRSGDLHLRSVELIEQAGGRVVAVNHVAVVYSPRTARYDLQTPERSWWRPAASQRQFFIRDGLKTEIPFRQRSTGNQPAPATINIWSLRLLRGTQLQAAPAWIDASLRHEVRDGAPWLVGSIRNLGDADLTEIAISTRQGTCAQRIASIPPGGTTKVEAPLAPDLPAALVNPSAGYGSPEARARGDAAASTPVDRVNAQGSTWAMMFAIDAERHERLLARVYHGDRARDVPGGHVVIVTATPASPDTPLRIADRSPLTHHRRVIRATFPLQTEPAR